MKILKPSKNILAKAVEILNSGGVIICPTDTVYGFLADATNKKAVDKIYTIKKRPKSKPLPVFIKDLNMAKKLAEIDEKQAKILRKFWPGKYTFILKRLGKSRYTTNIKALKFVVYGVKNNTIALRIPKYKFLNELLKKVNRPLVQTSVNISAQKPLKNIDEILATFGPARNASPARQADASHAGWRSDAGGKNKLVDLMIDGGSAKNAKPSKIIDLTPKLRVLTRIR